MQVSRTRRLTYEIKTPSSGGRLELIVMTDLQSSSDHRSKGLMSPRARFQELRRILLEMRLPEDNGKDASLVEIDAMQDLCFRLYSEVVADLMAARLGSTRQEIREALDAGLRWKS